MIGKLLKLLLIAKPQIFLSKEQESSVYYDIAIINLKRMKILLNTLMVLEFLFIIFNDIPNLINISTNTAWNDKRYFILHLLLLTIAFTGSIITKFFITNSKNKFAKIYNITVLVLTIVILIFIALLNGLDQIKTGSGNSIFIANVIMCSAVILIRFPISLIVYSLPFSIFIIGLILFQNNTALLISNIINGSIFFIISIIISQIIYNSNFAQISKSIILEETNYKLDYLSTHDPLTGLSNRRNFEIEILKKLEIIYKNKEEAALVLADIDYFKNINDQFGHPVGDAVLQEVSMILLQNIRHADLAVRWGGEEFLLFFSNTSITEAYTVANKIRLAIEKKIITINDLSINVTASFGVSQLKNNSFDDSYKLADKALYKAKAEGRNQVVLAPFTKKE